MTRVNGSVYETRVSNFVKCVAGRVFGPTAELSESIEEAIDSARQLGQEYMDSAQLAEGERQARAYVAKLSQQRAQLRR